VPYEATWAVKDEVVCRAIDAQDKENGQSALVVDRDWLANRLRELQADLVVGTLSEKTAMPAAENDESPIWSDITYVALFDADGGSMVRDPLLRVRTVGDNEHR